MSKVGDLPTGGMRLVPPRQALPTTLLPPEPAPSFPPPVSRPTSPPRPISEQRAVSPETAPQPAARHRTWRRRRLLLVMVLTLVVSQLAAVGLVASLRWVNPPTTAFLLEDGLASRRSNSTAEPPIREWVDIDARGYSADRTMIAAWTCGSRGPATTTRGRPGSSNPGSRPTPTAWTTWSGCAGRTASCALAATTPVGGRSVMAGTSAPAAGRVPR